MILVFGSQAPSFWLGQNAVRTGSGYDAGGNWIDQVFFLSIIVGSWIVASWRRVNWNKLFAANTAITLFYVYFITSCLWSAQPGDSFTRVLKDFGTTVLVISVILSENDPLEAVRAVYTRCACVLFPLSLYFIKYSYLSFGRGYTINGDIMYTGVTTHRNTLGQIAMVFCLFLIWDYLEALPADAMLPWGKIRWDCLVLLFMGAYLLFISESKTSLVCLLIGLPLLIGGRWLSSRVMNKGVLFAAMCLPFLTYFTPQIISSMEPLLGYMERDATLTGRTVVWQYIISTSSNPLLGAGFWSFWGGQGRIEISDAIRGFVINAHSGYLDIYLDGGLIGLALLFCLLLFSGKRLIINQMNRYQRMRYAFLIVAIIYNLTESCFARPSLIWFTALLVLIEFPFLRSNEKFGHELQERSTDRFVVEVGS